MEEEGYHEKGKRQCGTERRRKRSEKMEVRCVGVRSSTMRKRKKEKNEEIIKKKRNSEYSQYLVDEQQDGAFKCAVE